MTTIEDWNNQKSNQVGALVSDSDSEGSETASVTQTRHSDYIREVRADQRRLLSAEQQLYRGRGRLGHQHRQQHEGHCRSTGRTLY